MSGTSSTYLSTVRGLKCLSTGPGGRVGFIKGWGSYKLVLLCVESRERLKVFLQRSR